MPVATRTPRLVTANGYRSSRYFDIEITGRLDDLLVDAEDVIEARLNGRVISVEEYAEQCRPRGNTIFTIHRPIVAVSAVRFRRSSRAAWQDVDPLDVSTFKREGYVEIPSSIIGGCDVQITYTAGLDPIPGGIKQAVYLQAALLAFQDIEMYGGGDGKEPGIDYNERNITRWLKPFLQTASVHPNSIPVTIFRNPYDYHV